MLESETQGEITVVRFTVRTLMDVNQIKKLFDMIFQLTDDSGRRKLVLDLRNVEYLSSFVLGKLMMLRKKVEGAGGRMVLCNVAPQIRMIFQGPSKPLFDLYDNEQEALQSF